MKKIDLTKGSVFKGLFAFVMPVFLIYLFNSLYNAVNIFVLALSHAEEHMGMVASSFTPISLSIALLTGCGVASTFLIAQYVGGNDEVGRKKAIKTVIIFTMSFSILLMIICGVLSPLIIMMLNIDDLLYYDALRYLLIQCLILPFNGLIYTIHAISKGHGKPILPFIYSTMGVIFNLVFDFVFVYALNMKSDGAALSSLLAYICAACVIMIYLYFFKYKRVNHIKGIHVDKTMFKHLGKQVIPLSLQEALVIICFTVLMSVTNMRGIIDSNIVAVSDRITSITYAPILACGNAISAAVAQNLGAGNIKRTKTLIMEGSLMLVGFVVVFSLPFYIFSNYLAMLYGNDPVVIQGVCNRMWVVFIDLIICIGLTPLNGLASGSGHSNWSLYIYLSGDILIRIPLILILGLLGYDNWIVSISYPASSLLSLGVGLYFYFSKRWQNLNELPINIDNNLSKGSVK